MRRLMVAVLLVQTAGCVRVSKEDRAKILAAEPNFSQVLKQKEEMDRRIKSLKDELSRKNAEIKKKITGLKKGLAASKKEADLKIQALKSELDRERERIGRIIEGLKSELKISRAKLRSLGQMLKAVGKLVKTAEEAAPAEGKKSEWKERADALSGQIQKLEERITQLKEKLRLRLIQLKLLRQ